MSSSDAVSDAELLTDRLGNLTDNVYLGIGSDEFDMTDFEDDGYIIRSSGGEAVIVGKTAEGLSNGVRKYANYAESGTAGELDISYHEGYRVEKFTLAGVDISDYAIEYPESYNENMKFAVGEFIQLTEKACGVKLTSSVGITDRKYAIEFRHIDEITPKKHSYRYFFEESRFVIEGAVERGCMYGVYRFFKNELDWMGLAQWDYVHFPTLLPQSVLAESDHIDIPSHTSCTETSSFYCFFPYMMKTYGRKNDATYARFAVDTNAAHGLQNIGWGGYDVAANQICYNDEEIFTDIYNSIYEYVDNLTKAGYVIGKDLTSIDISQGDNSNYCKCNECMKVLKQENNANSGSVVRFANRMSEEMSVDFPGLKYLIYAYAGTQPPPKTAPCGDVYVSLCYDASCSAHPLGTGECPSVFHPDYINTQKNSDLAEWTKGWTALTKNMNVWYYLLDHNVDPYTPLKVLYDDMKFFADCGLCGVFIESETEDLGIMWTAAELADEMNWKPDMTRAEYEDYLCKILKKEYGDGWGEIREYIEYWQEAQDRSAYCWHCWGYGFSYHVGQYEYGYVADKFDYCLELADRAIELACDPRELRNCELFVVHILYQGCLSSYFKEYDEGDTERLEVLRERYDRMIALMKKYGINPDKLGWSVARIDEALEDTAWNIWIKIRDSLPCGEIVRPAP